MATEVDRLFVGLGMDAEDFDRALQSSTDKLEAWGQSMKSTGQTLTQSLTAPIGVAAGALLGLTERTAKYAEQVELAAAQSGIASEEIQEIAFAAESVSGVDFDSVRDGLKELALRSAEAAEGTGEAVEGFERLGISQQQLQSLSTAELFRRVREEMQGLTKAQRILTSEQIFGGEAGEKFAEVMSLSQSEMAGLRQEAQKSGAVLGGEQVANLDALRQSYNTAMAEVKGLGRELGTALVPIIRSAVIPAIRSMVDSARSLIQWFRGLSTTTKTWLGIITGAAAAIGPVLVALGTLSTLLSGLPALFTAVGTAAGAAWAAITSPVSLVVGAVAAVAGGAYLLISNWEGVSSFFSDLFSGLLTMAQGFREGFLGVWKKVSGEVVSVMLRAFREVLEGVQYVLESLGIERFQDSVDSAISTMESGIGRANEAARKGGKMMGGAWEKISAGAVEFGKDVSDVAGDVKDSILDMVTFADKKTGEVFNATGNAGSPGGGQGGGFGIENKLIEAPSVNLDAELNLDDEQVKKEAQTLSGPFKAVARTIDRSLSQASATITDMIVGTKSLGEGFESLEKIAVQSMKRVVQQIIEAIVKAVILKSLTAATGIPFAGAAIGSIPGVGKAAAAKTSAAAKTGASGGMAAKTGRPRFTNNRTIEIPVEMLFEGAMQGQALAAQSGQASIRE